MPQTPNLTYSAPVLFVDMPVADIAIWPCVECLPWHLEVIRTDDGGVAVREWHAADCPELQALLAVLEG